MTRLQTDEEVFEYLIELSGEKVMSWCVGASLARLRPDIAERLLAARSKIGRRTSELRDAELRVTMADDNLIQVLVDLFEKEHEKEEEKSR